MTQLITKSQMPIDLDETLQSMQQAATGLPVYYKWWKLYIGSFICKCQAGKW